MTVKKKYAEGEKIHLQDASNRDLQVGAYVAFRDGTGLAFGKVMGASEKQIRIQHLKHPFTDKEGPVLVQYGTNKGKPEKLVSRPPYQVALVQGVATYW